MSMGRVEWDEKDWPIGRVKNKGEDRGAGPYASSSLFFFALPS
jgi:hypothetical protein